MSNGTFSPIDSVILRSATNAFQPLATEEALSTEEALAEHAPKIMLALLTIKKETHSHLVVSPGFYDISKGFPLQKLEKLSPELKLKIISCLQKVHEFSILKSFDKNVHKRLTKEQICKQLQVELNKIKELDSENVNDIVEIFQNESQMETQLSFSTYGAIIEHKVSKSLELLTFPNCFQLNGHTVFVAFDNSSRNLTIQRLNDTIHKHCATVLTQTNSRLFPNSVSSLNKLLMLLLKDTQIFIITEDESFPYNYSLAPNTKLSYADPQNNEEQTFDLLSKFLHSIKDYFPDTFSSKKASIEVLYSFLKKILQNIQWLSFYRMKRPDKKDYSWEKVNITNQPTSSVANPPPGNFWINIYLYGRLQKCHPLSKFGFEVVDLDAIKNKSHQNAMCQNILAFLNIPFDSPRFLLVSYDAKILFNVLYGHMLGIAHYLILKWSNKGFIVTEKEDALHQTLIGITITRYGMERFFMFNPVRNSVNEIFDKFATKINNKNVKNQFEIIRLWKWLAIKGIEERSNDLNSFFEHKTDIAKIPTNSLDDLIEAANDYYIVELFDGKVLWKWNSSGFFEKMLQTRINFRQRVDELGEFLIAFCLLDQQESQGFSLVNSSSQPESDDYCNNLVKNKIQSNFIKFKEILSEFEGLEKSIQQIAPLPEDDTNLDLRNDVPLLVMQETIQTLLFQIRKDFHYFLLLIEILPRKNDNQEDYNQQKNLLIDTLKLTSEGQEAIEENTDLIEKKKTELTARSNEMKQNSEKRHGEFKTHGLQSLLTPDNSLLNIPKILENLAKLIPHIAKSIVSFPRQKRLLNPFNGKAVLALLKKSLNISNGNISNVNISNALDLLAEGRLDEENYIEKQQAQATVASIPPLSHNQQTKKRSRSNDGQSGSSNSEMDNPQTMVGGTWALSRFVRICLGTSATFIETSNIVGSFDINDLNTVDIGRQIVSDIIPPQGVPSPADGNADFFQQCSSETGDSEIVHEQPGVVVKKVFVYSSVSNS